jgi:hypothetical protein
MNNNINYDSDSDSDIDEHYYTTYYEPEEISKTKYNIVLSYLQYPDYIVCQRFKILDKDEINIHIVLMRLEGLNPKIDLAECLYLDTEECIAIKKTFWIKLIQRTWKNIMKKRKDVLNKRKSLFSLRYRETHGNWPTSCFYFPKLKGMLNNLYP